MEEVAIQAQQGVGLAIPVDWEVVLGCRTSTSNEVGVGIGRHRGN